MGKTGKKNSDEHLQEVRSKNANKLRYRKRVQQDEEAKKALKEYEDRGTERTTD